MGRTFVTGKDPWTHKNRNIEIDEYGALDGKTATRAVIIMPPTGGENLIDQRWAGQFCKNGIRAVIIKDFELLFNPGIDLSMYDHLALTSLVAIRQTVDYLTKSGSPTVGILGTSLGAIEASFAVVMDDRLKTATFIVGGMGLAQIAARSDEEGEKQLRDMRKQIWHMDQTQYEQALEKAVHIDVVPFIDPTLPARKKVLSIVAMDDTLVPTANQMSLYDAFGKQQVIPIEHEHVDTVVRTSLLHSKDVLDFFNRNL